MDMKKIILASILLLSVFALQAQEGTSIKFEETTHQFGKIKKNGPAEHTFVFTNVTEEPIKLTQVKASCGCTTPAWTKEAVAPGETGEIAVKYNTARVGPFTKTVTVRYGDGARPIILYIKGEVENTETVPDRFPYKQGSLGFTKLVDNIGTLDSDKKQSLVFEAKNIGPQPITFKEKVDQEMMINTNIAKTTLNPGESTPISVVIDGGKFITYGSFTKNIYLYTDEDQGEKKLTINGVVNKVFSAEELAAMPNIEFDRVAYDGGVVIEGEKVDVAYKFTNTGKSDLKILSVKASCGCTASAPKDDVIKAGMSSEIIASFNSKGRKGPQSKTITVKTNDPDQPTLVLRLKVEVEQNPFHIEEVGPANGNN